MAQNNDNFIEDKFAHADKSIRETSYINDLEDTDLNNDDFDVQLSVYHRCISFREFIKNPFGELDSALLPVMCKTGQIKLPKKIIDIYIKEKQWNFENYHQMELMALLYLHYNRDCDEWNDQKVLDKEIKTILEALPHFKSINEFITYVYASGDLKMEDFDQVIDVDSTGAEDMTGRTITS